MARTRGEVQSDYVRLKEEAREKQKARDNEEETASQQQPQGNNVTTNTVQQPQYTESQELFPSTNEDFNSPQPKPPVSYNLAPTNNNTRSPRIWRSNVSDDLATVLSSCSS
jgi:hypothetical protein